MRAWAVLAEPVGLNSVLIPVVYGDVALSIKYTLQYNTIPVWAYVSVGTYHKGLKENVHVILNSESRLIINLALYL